MWLSSLPPVVSALYFQTKNGEQCQLHNPAHSLLLLYSCTLSTLHLQGKTGKSAHTL